MGNSGNMLLYFKFNFFSNYIMENKLKDFIDEVRKAFPHIDEDVLIDYYLYGYTADEFIYRETELQNEDAEMEEQYKKDRSSWL